MQKYWVYQVNRAKTCYSSYIYPFDKFGKLGKIHSIFKHSFNIEVDKDLINIGGFDNYLSCYGINIPKREIVQIISKIKLANLVRVNSNSIAIYTQNGVQNIDLYNAYKVDLKINVLDNLYTDLLIKILKILEMQCIDEKIGISLNSKMKDISRKLSEKNDFDINTTVKWLLGRGKGLTPSGDDILCGYLFILLLINDKKRLHTIVEQINMNINLTTNISQAYLQCISNGYVNSRVYKLFCSLKEHIYKDMECDINEILKIGHTSGTDLMYGMKLAILYYLAQ